ncbi:MAG: hypothetical protein AAGK32_05330, partial [Actinomycetota bacterium]
MPDPATDARAGAVQSLPPVARVVINERRKRILRTVEGRVLDPSARARPGDLRRADEVVSGLAAAGDRPGTFDVVVSVLWLSGAVDPTAALDAAADALDEGGELVFLELVPETGVGRHGQRLVSPLPLRSQEGGDVPVHPPSCRTVEEGADESL